MNNLTAFIIALGKYKGIGPATILKFLENIDIDNEEFLKFEKLLESPLKPISRLVDSEILTQDNFINEVNIANKSITNSEKNNIQVINYKEESYPYRMLEQKSFPLIIYIKGDIELLNREKMITIVGTRNPTAFGMKMNNRITKLFVDDGYVVVSGLAKGHDAIAHQSTLEFGGKTIAILAHGLNQPIYPKENAGLAQEIIESGGILLSTYPDNTALLPQYLVQRDEWQVSLSDGVIAVETGEKGGTNHAINHSLKQNKPIAMLDHRAFDKFNNDTLKDYDQISGNIKRIDIKEVQPIFTKESIDLFKKEIKEFQKLKMINSPINKNEKKVEKKEINKIEQISLFDFD